MLTFVEYLDDVLNERILSIGLNSDHEHFREKHRDEIHDMIQRSYSHPDIGGYGGNKSGSKEESEAIHKDISDSLIKATKRDGKITAVNLYKKHHGRKSIASGTDGSVQVKQDLKKTKLEDHEQKRAWGESSGAVEHMNKKIGMPVVPAKHAKDLLGKDVKVHDDGEHYTRKIGDHEHTKVIMGHPKVSKKT